MKQDFPFVYWSRVIGRDNDRKDIVAFLTESRSKKAVVTISGDRGIGKTELAKLVFQDEEVRRHFDPVIWYDDLDLNTVIEDLRNRNQTELVGKQPLVVLDGVSHLTRAQCNELRDLLKVGPAGVLIVTTDQCIVNLVGESFTSCDGEGNEDEDLRKPTQSLNQGIGRKEVKDQIMKFILNNCNKQLSTLSIVGQSNTLLESICDDKNVQSQFGYWKRVHVSCKEFNLKKIVEYILGDDSSDKTLELLLLELRNLLQNKKFLLVLEDLLDLNPHQWDNLQGLLMNDKIGNKVLITTGDQQVALLADGTIQLEPLYLHMRMHLEPLCVNDVYEKTNSSLMDIMKLSFDALPSFIKICFVYSICFPVHPPSREKLTQQWIAHGFIEPLENNQKLEDLASEYLDVLLSRSFFYNQVQDDFMAETRFEVHEVIRHLAQSVSKGECSVTSSDKIDNIPSSVLHVAFRDESKEEFPSELMRLKKLRTLKWEKFGSMSTTTLNVHLFSRTLRVLDLSCSVFEELTSSIDELCDLRYLDLSGNVYLESLPSSLFNLYNLETLRVDRCGIEEIPREIMKLQKLRNLYACTEQVFIPEEVCCLTSLRILHLDPIHNLKSLPEGLENLTALETLVLKSCSNLKFLEGDLKCLRSLRSLTITHLVQKSILPRGLLDAASTLSSLCLFYCLELAPLPEWLEKLRCLRKLRVEFCPNLTAPTEGICLPSGLLLQDLSICGCPQIHLDGRRLKSTSSVDVKKDNRDGGNITDVGFSKLPSSSSGPVEGIYEGEAMSQSCPPYSKTSTLIAPSGKGSVEFTSNSDFIEFGSRLSTMHLIKEALGDDSCDIVGIVGMGGVGKTAIVDEIARKAPQLKLSRVVKIVVTQTVDVKRIQDEIASAVNLRFHPDEADEPSRADQLFRSLSDESKRILVILDDVWSSKDSTTGKGLLEAVGIPRGGCKIILTTRREAVCDNMGIREEHKTKVDVLTDMESEDLLRKRSGMKSGAYFPYYATLECHGLPIALLEWMESRIRRTRGKLHPLLEPAVHSCLKLSYDYIREKETKFCFLLCCLFPEGKSIDTEFIARYAMGIGLFRDTINTMSQVRAHVIAVIEDLTGSSLLIKSWPNNFRMHGLVRKFAISIASEGDHKFFIESGANLQKWPERNLMEQSTYISLMENQIEELPEKPECPTLELLSLLGNTGLKNIPDSCFQGMTMLRVLDLSESYFDSILYYSRTSTFKLPKSLECLGSLRTLLLVGCQLEGGLPTIIGKLKKLEILSLRGSNIRELPKEVGRLSQLRLLDLEDCKQLESIPANVISKLCNLEELYTKGGFRNWKVIKGGGTAVATRGNASLSEIQSLSSLAAFSAGVNHLDCLPNDFSFSSKSTKFDLVVGSRGLWDPDYILSFINPNIMLGRLFNSLSLSFLDLNDCPDIRTVSSLFPKVDYLNLQGVEVSAILSDSDHERGGCFNALKSLRLSMCNGLEYLCGSTSVAFENLEELRLEYLSGMKVFGEAGVPSPASFQNLKILELGGCDGLGVVIPCNWIRNLPRLEQLRVSDCSSLREIIVEVEGVAEESEMIQPLSNLKELHLSRLDGLVTICKGRPGKFISFSNLIKLHISECPQLASIFSPYISQTLLHLRKLTIRQCDNLKVIFEKGAPVDEIQQIEFPKLEKISVCSCKQLRSLLPISIARGLVKLQELKILDCRNLGELVSWGDTAGTLLEANSNEIQLSCLTKMKIRYLSNLKRFCRIGYSLGLPSLQELKLIKCPKLANLTYHAAAASYGLTKIPASARILYVPTSDEFVPEKGGEAKSVEQKTGVEGQGETKQSAKGKVEEMEDHHIHNKDVMKIMFPYEELLSPTQHKVGRRFRRIRKRKMGNREMQKTDEAIHQQQIIPVDSPGGLEYEVFLSFRGEDTRLSFADHLYSYLMDLRIQTLRDNEELYVGEHIGPRLVKAIEQCKILIPIFSKGYASSEWCLMELAHMVKCFEKSKDRVMIYPIFYDVTPSEVRNQTGNFRDAFDKHVKKFDKERVDQWKEALRKVSQLKDWEKDQIAVGHELELVKRVAAKVLMELKKKHVEVTENLVGMEQHQAKLMRLLDLESNDVRIVGIVGMGGIGKTTIAKFIYNKVCESFSPRCSILENVQEKVNRSGGLDELKKQLISDIWERELEGMEMYGRTFKSTKALILIDDVENRSQLMKIIGKCDWYGPGSRIIVTTRNRDTFRVLEGAEKIYEPPMMDSDNALRLFCKHAFRQDFPLEGYESLSKEVVAKVAGLPLSLEVIGSLLYTNQRELWFETLEKLQQMMPNKVKKSLEISYDRLDDVEKKIFLDIACHFIDSEEDEALAASYMWEDCQIFPKSSINTLVTLSLVKVDGESHFWMHDQLRDLGREIVREENPNNPGARSRLWSHEEALDVLTNRRATERVETLTLWSHLYPSDDYCLSNEEFKGLSRLRYLDLSYVSHLKGDFTGLLSELRWFRWHVPSQITFTNFCLPKLVVLDLSHSNISDGWEDYIQIKRATNLKLLNLSNCSNLTKIPDLSAFPKLERLNLRNCSNLAEIKCPSVGHLQHLKFLNLNYCHKCCEEELPDGTSSESKWKLPEFIWNLKSLVELHMQSVPITELSEAIGNLTNLTILDIGESCIKKLPNDAIGKLEKLVYLDASWCESLEELPETIGDLQNLRQLSISLSGIKRLPSTIGRLGLLERLYASECKSLEELPDSIGNLTNLQQLNLRSSGIKKLPAGIGMLQKLEWLDCGSCSSLQGELPSGVLRLPALRELVLYGTKISGVLPTDISCCSHLTTLNLGSCPDLRLPSSEEELRLPLGLEVLEILLTKASLESVASLPKLKRLIFHWCDNTDDSVEYPINLGGSTPELTGFSLYGFENYASLPVRINNMPWLRSLYIGIWDDDYYDVEEGLLVFEGSEILLERLPDLPNSLEKIHISDCPKLYNVDCLATGGLMKLTKLSIENCPSLESLPDFSVLQCLERLCIYGCEKLCRIKGLESLTGLRHLELINCPSLEKLPDLSHLKINCYEFDIGNCGPENGQEEFSEEESDE